LEDDDFKEIKIDSFEGYLSISREQTDKIIKDVAGDEE